jgi:hypothetical protein
MSSTYSTDDTVAQSDGATPRPVSKLVDWLVAAFLVLGGVVFAGLGALMYSVADLDFIASLVADGRLQSTELTDAQLIEVTYGLLWWGAIGLAVTGALLLGSALVFVAYRRRARRRRAEAGVETPDTAAIALAGGVVTIVTSFVPLSPILGGFVSGYLRGGDSADGARVGAYSGLVATLPLAVLGLVLLGGFAVVAAELALGAVAVFVGFALVFALLVGVGYMVALGALGGYFGVGFAADDAPVEDDVAA